LPAISAGEPGVSASDGGGFVNFRVDLGNTGVRAGVLRESVVFD
jgi:hypothetical protein